MSAHTPGPWAPGWIYGAIRHINKNVDDEAFWGNDEEKAAVEAGTLHTPNVRSFPGDAPLITAAPDLLAACEAVREAIRDHVLVNSLPTLNNEGERLCSLLNAAIAKARGGK